ncbi:hypothetical protein CYLTODRAFT_491720 [Cylindrobasidium torrendii FP15055 ss-10]|uniref:MYND-type domain-containing protein n=1 Tax=Cylindrobasidium torrendii FP15055 ss-10 TaxID=1314674 RepID=A0A0D7B7H8_9AGAR|nr:hypothetical protein CYLTODRAFT_491720 [Cylindrobasidium torrendii FP15055 ss-10]
MSASLQCALAHDVAHPSSDSPPKLCGNCKTVSYCSAECQQKDWDNHVFECKSATPASTKAPKPSTAQRLLRAIRVEKSRPTHFQTREDWGFVRASILNTSEEQLFDFYTDLLVHRAPNLTSKDLKQWAQAGLVTKIRETYELDLDFDEANPSHAYTWFLKNLYVFDTSILPTVMSTPAAKHIADATGLPFDVGNVDISGWSLRKKIATQVYTVAWVGAPIVPGHSGFVEFGYVAGSSMEDYQKIGRAYTKLIKEKGCTWEFFSEAHERGRMLELLQTSGLVPNGFKHFALVLSQKDGEHAGVWRLKEYLQVAGGSAPQRYPEVMEDYGFVNCQNDTEKGALLDVYTAMLMPRSAAMIGRPLVDELELHNACMKGELGPFALKHMEFTSETVSEMVKRLLVTRRTLQEK